MWPFKFQRIPDQPLTIGGVQVTLQHKAKDHVHLQIDEKAVPDPQMRSRVGKAIINGVFGHNDFCFTLDRQNIYLFPSSSEKAEAIRRKEIDIFPPFDIMTAAGSTPLTAQNVFDAARTVAKKAATEEQLAILEDSALIAQKKAVRSQALSISGARVIYTRFDDGSISFSSENENLMTVLHNAVDKVFRENQVPEPVVSSLHGRYGFSILPNRKAIPEHKPVNDTGVATHADLSQTDSVPDDKILALAESLNQKYPTADKLQEGVAAVKQEEREAATARKRERAEKEIAALQAKAREGTGELLANLVTALNNANPNNPMSDELQEELANALAGAFLLGQQHQRGR